MKKLILLLTFLLPIVGFSVEDLRVEQRFAFDTDVVFLKRKKIGVLPLAEMSSASQVNGVCIPCSGTGTVQLDTLELVSEMPRELGIRLTAYYYYNKKSSWQTRYLGRLNFKGEGTAKCTNNLRFPFKTLVTQDYINAHSMRATYWSDFYTFELNYFRHLNPREMDRWNCSGIFGLRYLCLDEKLAMNFRKNTHTSTFLISTGNMAIGPQAGVMIEGIPNTRWTWGGFLKTGVLGNGGEQHTFLRDQNNTVTLRNVHLKGVNVSWFLESLIFIDCLLHKNFKITAMWEYIGLKKVCLAPMQIDYSDAESHLHHHGRILMNGYSFGFGWVF